MKLLGLDPGLRRTGWGVVAADGARLRFLACGLVTVAAEGALADRLQALYDGVAGVIAEYAPDEAAIEETFVNKNPQSTLKLGQARGVVMLAPARAGIPVVEYTPNLVKKSVVGAGHAAKEQVAAMVQILLPGCRGATADAADALAVAICHAHHRATAERIGAALAEVRP